MVIFCQLTTCIDYFDQISKLVQKWFGKTEIKIKFLHAVSPKRLIYIRRVCYYLNINMLYKYIPENFICSQEIG